MRLLTLSFLLPFVLGSPRQQLDTRQAKICGVNGYDKGVTAFYVGGNVVTASEQANCRTLCLSNAQCLSYAVGGNSCLQYSKSL